MRRYGRIQGLVLALGWADFYRDVARKWRGIGLLYVLLAIMLTWIPILANMQSAAGRFIEELPELSIKKGIASSPAVQPFDIIKDGDRPFFVLDTTGKTRFDKTDAKILITDTKFFLRNDMGQEQVHNLIKFPDIDITKEALARFAATVSSWLGVVLFPFVVIGSLVGWLIVMLLAGAIGMAANGKARLPFSSVLRLAAVGSTLGIYFVTAVTLLSISVPPLLLYPICVGFTVAYVIFGIKCVERDPLEELEDDYGRGEDRRDHGRDDSRSPTSPPTDGPSDAFRSGPTGP